MTVAPIFHAEVSSNSEEGINETVSRLDLGSKTLELFSKTNTQPMMDSQKSNTSSKASVEEITRSPEIVVPMVDAVIDLTDDDKTPSGLKSNDSSSRNTKTTDRTDKKRPRFYISDSDEENRPPIIKFPKHEMHNDSSNKGPANKKPRN